MILHLSRIPFAVPETNKYGECPEVSSAVLLPVPPSYRSILSGVPIVASASCAASGAQIYTYYTLKGILNVSFDSIDLRDEKLIFSLIYSRFLTFCFHRLVPSPCRNLNIVLTRKTASSPNLVYLVIGQYPNLQPTLDTVGYVALLNGLKQRTTVLFLF